MIFIRRAALAIGAAGLLPLTACSEEPADTAAIEPSEKNLSEALASSPDLTAVALALKDTGLASVFAGPGSYTILAPNDGAFSTLSEDRELLGDQEQRAVVVAILRDHVVPGFLLPADITEAIDASPGGKVEMTTMANHKLTFSKSGDDIVATSQDGSSAKFEGSPIIAGNGVAIPIDSVLKAKSAE